MIGATDGVAPIRLRLQVAGIVQGVGFRPFVHRLAGEHRLAGWVRNGPDGVAIEVQGAEGEVRAFVAALGSRIPPPARVDRLGEEAIACDPAATGFSIVASAGEGPPRPVLPADLAACPACVGELRDAGDRRYRYPFTNCTHCGPRYSIVTALPYDRPRTSMAGFALCRDCAREYGDVADRRYHAQPTACPACGPRLALCDRHGAESASGDAALGAAAAALLGGEIVALKGLGGYQLLVDATAAMAVARLRQRKRRPAKPLAVMFADLAALGESCVASAAERAELASPRAPIVLLERRAGGPVAAEVAPQNPRLGAMLPTTPLHHLLLERVARPLVCTSGNLAEEPMAIDDADARARLGAIADWFLVHDRPIVRPIDDSVIRLDDHGPTVLRRARGFAPGAHPVPYGAAPVLGLGGHQKSTIALIHRGEAVLSQHLGDLATAQGEDLLERTVRDLLAFFAVRPAALACDLHPDYASTRLAERLAGEWGAPLFRVQHHHAHALACAAEHRLEEPFLALAWDGTGLGSDGTIWGGEALRIEGPGWRRVGALKPFPLPGGEAAIREPRRSALGLWWSIDPRAPMPEEERWFVGAEGGALRRLLEQRLCCPLTSSMGRLFDAVAALSGARWEAGFDGQAAMALEFAAAGGPGAGPSWRFGLARRGDLLEADPAPLIRALVAERSRGRRTPELAAEFHRAVADLALAWARHGGLKIVGLTGGCFQNRHLAALVRQRLEGAGFQVLGHRAFPPNDGSLSLGQAALGALSLGDGAASRSAPPSREPAGRTMAPGAPPSPHP